MPDRQLEKKVALVTGAGRGIGREIALGFAKEGASVAAASRTRGELDSLTADIQALGGSAVGFQTDLTDSGVVKKLTHQVLDAFGTVDILVNNAGIGTAESPRLAVEFDDDYWNLTMALNLTAPYLLSKAVLPYFLKKRKGRIINIASLAGKIGISHGVAYTASKHGLLGLTRALATEVAKEGITVNAICPGPVRSRMNDGRVRFDAERLGLSFEELESRITPIGRRLEPEEIVPMAVLLASDGASGITGQAFNICGGLVMF
jgi:3-hydroxybutyrate dehydrogenase